MARLAGEGRALVAEVSSLLGAEARERAADFRTGAVLLAGGLGALLLGLAVASGAAVAALAMALPLWAAALVVGSVEHRPPIQLSTARHVSSLRCRIT